MSSIRENILWSAAKRLIRRKKPFIIAVTGSIAKTSTKIAIGSVLERGFPGQVRVGFGNLNSYLGVPLSILGYEIDFYKQKITWQWLWILKIAIWRGFFGTLPKYIVLEFGADAPGDIGAIAKHLRLDVAVITIVSAAHLKNYGSIEQIAAEKAKIFSCLKDTGTAIINANDPYKSRYHFSPQQKMVEVKTETNEIARNVAREIGRQLHIASEEVEGALSKLQAPEGRLRRIQTREYLILDDSYNANPLSMEVALKELEKLPGKKVAILGDMLELGSQEIQLHEEVGKKAKVVADQIIGVGLLASHYHPDKLFSSASEASREIFRYLKGADSILVKGSHGVHLEHVVEELKRDR